MTFLAMIVALILLWIWGADNPLHQDTWYRSLQSSVINMGLSPQVGFIVCIAAPLLVAGFLLNAVESLLFGLLWMAGAVVILLYAFGREDQRIQADRYRNYCLRGDFEAAYLYAQSVPGVQSADGDFFSPLDVHRLMTRELLYCGYQRWFSVLFYFLVLGPVGALAYRLIQLSRITGEQEMAARLLYYADWVPARLLAAVFALAGDFIGSRDELQSTLFESELEAGAVLVTVGRAAVGSPPLEDIFQDTNFTEIAADEVSEQSALLSRSATAWVLAIALLVLLV